MAERTHTNPLYKGEPVYTHQNKRGYVNYTKRKDLNKRITIWEFELYDTDNNPVEDSFGHERCLLSSMSIKEAHEFAQAYLANELPETI